MDRVVGGMVQWRKQHRVERLHLDRQWTNTRHNHVIRFGLVEKEDVYGSHVQLF